MGPCSAEITEQHMREKVKTLATEAVDLHRKVCATLRELAHCDEDGLSTRDLVFSICTKKLSEVKSPAVAQNPVLGRFLNDLLSHVERFPLYSRQMARIVGDLFTRRVEELENYLEILYEQRNESTLQYWKRFGQSQSTSSVMQLQRSVNEGESSYVFPGRQRVRNGVTFDKVDKQACTKNNVKGRTSAVPSIFTVQCACTHPKIFGFLLPNKCESISAALSAIITHFPIPPRNIWYDNACNTYDSGMLRILWLMRWSRLLVDRYNHCTGHNCSNVFNGDLHNDLDQDRSVAAEVIDSVINKGTNHIAYLDGKNVKPFMKGVFAYVNSAAAVRDKVRRDDLEDDDVEGLISDMYTCNCETCTHCRDTGMNAEELIVQYGVYLFTKQNEINEIDTL